jgi:hypothetical protein
VTTWYAQECGGTTFHQLTSGPTEEAHGTTVCGSVATFGEWGAYEKRPIEGSDVKPCMVCFAYIADWPR